MEAPIRIGTRGSPLALAQARMVAEALRTAHGWNANRIEIVPITTSGDVIQDRPLAEVGGKGLWTKELDRCLLDGRTHLSVHSMKDVETFRPPELEIAALLPRADVRDRLVGADSLAGLPRGARVGTSSPRRAAQLLCQRPDFEIVPFRGNVATRLAKVTKGEASATLLAAAGLDRLGKSDVGTAIETDQMLPAPAQGAIGVEVLAGNKRLKSLLRDIDDGPTHACVAAERRFLEALGADCHSAVGALAEWQGYMIRLRAEILTPDGAIVERGETSFAPEDDDAPADLARRLLDQAAPALREMFAA